VRLLLHQFCLLPFEFCLLYGKEDPVLLQHPVKVKGLPVVGRKGAHPGQVILSDNFGLGTLCVAFHTRPPKARSKVARPSSHTTMALSLLSNSSNAANVTTMYGGGEDIHPTPNHDQGHREKLAQAITGMD
jgi:hypothetical protein